MSFNQDTEVNGLIIYDNGKVLLVYQLTWFCIAVFFLNEGNWCYCYVRGGLLKGEAGVAIN